MRGKRNNWKKENELEKTNKQTSKKDKKEHLQISFFKATSLEINDMICYETSIFVGR